jgi:hypothetical protein
MASLRSTTRLWCRNKVAIVQVFGPVFPVVGRRLPMHVALQIGVWIFSLACDWTNLVGVSAVALSVSSAHSARR